MKITFHYTYIFIALSFILTGLFPNLIIFTSIIIIHELGHYLTAKYQNLSPIKIIIYPYGGITKLNIKENTTNKSLFIIAISGLIFQSIYFLIITLLYKQNIIREYIFNIFKQYHQSIFLFNILPIYPLDGSKIINIFLSKFIPYKKTQNLTILISIITIFFLIFSNYYKFNYTTILIITIIIDYLIKYHKNINYLYNKFLLERYLYHYKFKKTKIIKNINNMYKEKTHILKIKNNYFTEKQILNNHFNKNTKNV